MTHKKRMNTVVHVHRSSLRCASVVSPWVAPYTSVYPATTSRHITLAASLSSRWTSSVALHCSCNWRPQSGCTRHPGSPRGPRSPPRVQRPRPRRLPCFSSKDCQILLYRCASRQDSPCRILARDRLLVQRPRLAVSPCSHCRQIPLHLH